MKEIIFSFARAAFAAFLSVALLRYVDEKTGFVADYFSWFVNFVHSHGYNVSYVVFFALLITYKLTHVHRYVGKGLLIILGIGIALIRALIIIAILYLILSLILSWL